MTSDQERTVEALSLFHGGWAKVEDVSDEGYPEAMCPVVRCSTAGDQPNYLVFEDGSCAAHAPWDQLWTMSAAEVQLAVYALEGLAG